MINILLQSKMRTSRWGLLAQLAVFLVVAMSIANVRLSFTPLQSIMDEDVEIPQHTTSPPQKNNTLHTFLIPGYPYKVQAWPDRGDVKPPRVLPDTDRPLFLKLDHKLLPHLLANHTKYGFPENPALPTMSDANKWTAFNLEIPLNYSVEAHQTTKIPWSNVSTTSFYEGRFRSGYRNQMMSFTILILEAIRSGHGQFLLRSLPMKDTYGTNGNIPFERLWDIPHWNSYYPRLPRFVDYDPVLHSQFNYDSGRWFRSPEGWFGTYGLFVSQKPTRPYTYGYQHKLLTAYIRYGKGNGIYSKNGHRHPAEKLMLREALRPHPDLQAIIDRLQAKMFSNITISSDKEPSYMTVHARVEPDMQRHPVCRDKKVLNLTDIFDFLERQWPEPPVDVVFLPINRQYLEKEGTPKSKDKKKKKKINWIAVKNLRALNHARDHGLWNGRVKVVEFGANALVNTTYAKKPSTPGAMLNFFLSISASIFVGTEVSSFSLDLLGTRFFRGNMENYKYLPNGLHRWTKDGMVDPPGFHC